MCALLLTNKVTYHEYVHFQNAKRVDFNIHKSSHATLDTVV